MPENMILLGKRIRHLRKARSMTPEELAVASDIGVKYLSRIERGDTNVTVRLLDRIAAALNVETADLLRVKQERSRAELEQELYSMIRTAREEKLRFLYRIASLD